MDFSVGVSAGLTECCQSSKLLLPPTYLFGSSFLPMLLFSIGNIARLYFRLMLCRCVSACTARTFFFSVGFCLQMCWRDVQHCVNVSISSNIVSREYWASCEGLWEDCLTAAVAQQSGGSVGRVWWHASVLQRFSSLPPGGVMGSENYSRAAPCPRIGTLIVLT